MTPNERNRIIGRRLVHDFHGEFEVVEGLGRTDVCPRNSTSQWHCCIIVSLGYTCVFASQEILKLGVIFLSVARSGSWSIKIDHKVSRE